MIIPSFMLAKLYVKGSLRNNADGYEFLLKNIIDSTSLMKVGPFEDSGVIRDQCDISITIKDKTWAAAELSSTATAPLPVNTPCLFKVKGPRLPAGLAKIAISLEADGAGVLKFAITDELS